MPIPTPPPCVANNAVEVAVIPWNVEVPVNCAVPRTESVDPGDVVPIPTLEFSVSKDKRGTALAEVAKENALTADCRVVLASPLY